MPEDNAPPPESTPAENTPTSEEPAKPPPMQKWRFRAKRKSDGSEIIGPVLELPFRPVALPAPVWEKDDNPHDSLSPLLAEVPGFDGRMVRFLIEEEDGKGGWVLRQVVHTKIEGGKAQAMIKLAHPMGETEPDLTPDPEPDPHAPPPVIDPKLHESHAIRARAELI